MVLDAQYCSQYSGGSAPVGFHLFNFSYGPPYVLAFLVPVFFGKFILLLADSGNCSETFQHIFFLC